MPSSDQVDHEVGTATQSAKDTRRMIRGSSLLTIGRVIAIVLNFVVQVVTVRLLTNWSCATLAGSRLDEVERWSLDDLAPPYIPMPR